MERGVSLTHHSLPPALPQHSLPPALPIHHPLPSSPSLCFSLTFLPCLSVSPLSLSRCPLYLSSRTCQAVAHQEPEPRLPWRLSAKMRVRVRDSAYACVCACVYACVCLSVRACMYITVCVCERERVSVCVRVSGTHCRTSPQHADTTR